LLGVQIPSHANSATSPARVALTVPTETVTDSPNTSRLGLTAAIEYAILHNRDMLSARLGVQSSRISLTRSQAEFKSHITPGGVLSTSSDSSKAGYGLRVDQKLKWGTQLEGGLNYRSVSDGPDTASLSVEVVQPLFSGAGVLVNAEPIRSAELEVIAARRTFQMRKTNLILEVVRVFESTLRGQRQIAADARAYERLVALDRLTRAREAQGVGTKVDSLRVELQLGEVSSQLENSRERYAAELDDLRSLLGWKGTNALELESPPLLDLKLPAFEVAATIAFGNRLDYAQALQNYRDVLRKGRIARKLLQPDLSITTRYAMDGGNNGDRPFDFGEDAWFVGLTVASDLHRREERADYEQSKIARKQVAIALDDLEYEITRDVRQQIRAYRRAQTDLSITRRNAAIASKRQKLAERLFRMGMGDNFAVTDAESAFLDATNTKYAARAEASLSGYRLLAALGTLIESSEDLKPVPIRGNRHD
jgi:outer membrane protein TolC